MLQKWEFGHPISFLRDLQSMLEGKDSDKSHNKEICLLLRNLVFTNLFDHGAISLVIFTKSLWS